MTSLTSASLPEAALPRAGAPQASVSVIGAGGSGKTHLLAAARRRCAEAGRPVLNLRCTPDGVAGESGPIESGAPASRARELLDPLGSEPWLVTLDDVHMAGDAVVSFIEAVASLAPSRGGGLALARRPWPRRSAIVAVEKALDVVDVRLRPLSAADVLRWPGVDGDQELADGLVVSSGGSPAMIVALLRDGGPPSGAVGVGTHLLATVGRELELLHDPARHVLIALTLGSPVPTPSLIPALGGDETTVAALTSSGLVDELAAAPPVVSAAVTALADPGERSVVAGRVAEYFLDDGAPAEVAAPFLAAAGRISTRGARVLLDAARTPVIEPEVGLAWVDAARRAGARGDEVDTVAAELTWRSGRHQEAMARMDSLLAAGATSRELVALAAVAMVANGRLVEASARFEALLADDPTGLHQSRAALCAALAGAEAPAGDEQPVSPLADVNREMTSTLDHTLTSGDRATIRSAALRLAGRSMGHDPLAPEEPVTLAATLLAITGATDEAARMLETADPAPRAQLLRVLLAVRAGRLAEAKELLKSMQQGETGPLTPRNALVAAAASTGITRRGTDHSAVGQAWELAAPLAMSCDVEPALVWLWGELATTAARVGSPDSDVVTQRIVDAMGGRGGLWAAETDWWRLQCAVAADDAALAADAAGRLEQLDASLADVRVGVLAGAANVWAELIAGRKVAAGTVEEMAGALAEQGLPWEGSALAGAAALRTTDSDDSRRLLAAGRKLKEQMTDESDGGAPGALSEREAEVAELVIQGLTHKEIGARLYISAKTVEHHVARIRQKLGATTRAEMLGALRSLFPTEPDD